MFDNAVHLRVGIESSEESVLTEQNLRVTNP